jgi:hypothetical protein
VETVGVETSPTQTYYLVPWLLCAVAAAAALDELTARAFRVRPVLCWAAAATVVVAAPLLRNWGACDLGGATWVRELARHKLEHTDPGGTLISNQDPDTFPLWYVRDVLGVRGDVLVLDYGLLRFSYGGVARDPSAWYLHRLRRDGVPIATQVPTDSESRGRLEEDGALIDLLAGPRKGRALCVTFLEDPGRGRGAFWRWALALMDPVPQGLVLKYQPKSDPVSLGVLIERNERLWSGIRLPPIGDIRTDQEYGPDYVANHYASMLARRGRLYELAGRPEDAAAIYRAVLDWFPGHEGARKALESLRRTSG